MEDVVDARALRQLQAICDLAHTCCDLKRPSKPGAQLAPQSRHHRLHGAV